MPTVTVEGEKSFEVESGKKLVLAIEDAGIDIMHKCGGNARCTTCRVEILGGTPDAPGPAEKVRLSKEADLAPNTRLACQVLVTGDLWVSVINRAGAQGADAGPRPRD
ncbi:2Fe-2S iron-sulfur cluster-binding protein [Aquisphaera insulae]|uniref:2Fe-2S iron-sulfur cluster-binding protein n=1 Tax=Aquisphaera insulae TaxID=2712864 RepID=UPI0013EB3B0B|nr:2Fe-2S iron-sulfur cluster-binding protein [Aquisphaera insulae]